MFAQKLRYTKHIEGGIDMHFAENLKQLRKTHQLSQEELAELLQVSRQAVSKWEQGAGYPEAETLLQLSRKLNVSLDALMNSGFSPASAPSIPDSLGSIVIHSPYENIIATCYKVMTSARLRGGKQAPRYALFGVNKNDRSFWGEPTTFLGWYADKTQIAKELEAIHQAIVNGKQTYTLQYAAKTERRWASIKMVEDDTNPVL